MNNSNDIHCIHIVIINIHNEATFKFLNVRGIWGTKTSNISRITSNNNGNNWEKKKNTIELNSQHGILGIK